MSENLLIYIAVIIFISIFVVALGVVIIVLIVQYINDKKKKKDQLLKVIIRGINPFLTARNFTVLEITFVVVISTFSVIGLFWQYLDNK